jgi:hypothetical protein
MRTVMALHLCRSPRYLVHKIIRRQHQKYFCRLQWLFRRFEFK